MLALKLVPDIHYFDTFKEFAEEFKLGKGDILVTNEWMYKPYVEGLGLDMPVVYQEKFGAGEPTDEMMDAMKAEMDQYEYDRIIAFGGGTIVDCCKVLACEIPDKVAHRSSYYLRNRFRSYERSGCITSKARSEEGYRNSGYIC